LVIYLSITGQICLCHWLETFHILFGTLNSGKGGKRQALTQDELDRLFAALKGNRHGHRDYMIALVTFLHGLRVSELIDLRWDDIDWRKGTIAIRRLKGSIDGTHYLERDEAIGLSDCSESRNPGDRTSSPPTQDELDRLFVAQPIERTMGPGTALRNARVIS
jgi:integrase